MILVLGGTLEGREIAGALADEGFKVLVTVVSGYGAELIPQDLSVEVLVCQLDSLDLEQLVDEKKIKYIVDATHPYARVITDTAWKVAQKRNVPYIRFERPPVTEEIKGDLVFRALGYEEAAGLAVCKGSTVFLTIGSRNLEPFVRAGKENCKRIVARVLPDAGVLQQCAALQMPPGDIIAVQGPFSLEMNQAMFLEYGAEVLVTKDSGRTGGTDTKIAAALGLKIPVIIVNRPDYGGVPVVDRIETILENASQYASQKSGY
ncbi:precorrin-6A reductase [Phosphitispora sp. TUW77]|uniref:precorrin-6A reductase n=1 Tax=Phosphitispora sp. TUW77 TaxID=3152361 RepID=UPI003AB90827